MSSVDSGCLQIYSSKSLSTSAVTAVHMLFLATCSDNDNDYDDFNASGDDNDDTSL